MVSARKHTFWRFLGVGGFCAVVNLSLLVGAVEWLGWHYIAGLMLGFLLSNLIGFHLNRLLTFQSNGKGHLTRYMLVMAVSAGLYAAGVFLTVDLVGLPYLMAATGMTGLMALLNFWAHKRWSFKG